jgi:hypothetical protein
MGERLALMRSFINPKRSTAGKNVFYKEEKPED